MELRSALSLLPDSLKCAGFADSNDATTVQISIQDHAFSQKRECFVGSLYSNWAAKRDQVLATE